MTSDCCEPAVDDTAGFTPQLLTSTGPVNGLLPDPGRRHPDRLRRRRPGAGADRRRHGRRPARDQPAGRDRRRLVLRAERRRRPGVRPGHRSHPGRSKPDGTVNRNSGAESTIHGLLTMQVLDAHPELAALAQASASIRTRDGLRIIEAEAGTVTPAQPSPNPCRRGPENLSGAAVRRRRPRQHGDLATAADTQARLIQPVVELTPDSPAHTTSSRRVTPGHFRYGAVGPQGNAPSPTELVPIELRREWRGHPVSARTAGGMGALDALMVMPEVATLLSDGGGRVTALLTSKSRTRRSSARSPSVDPGRRPFGRTTAPGGRSAGRRPARPIPGCESRRAASPC